MLAIAAPLALLVPRPAVRWLLGIVAGSTLLWARGWQDLRFLLTLYPLLALLGASGIDALLRRRPLAAPGAAGPAAVSVAVAWLCLLGAGRQLERARDAAPVVLGREPVAAYLGRKLTDFGAVGALNAAVAPGRATLFLGDGQIWYCRQRCIPDPAHDNLLQWFVRPGSVERRPAGAASRGRVPYSVEQSGLLVPRAPGPRGPPQAPAGGVLPLQGHAPGAGLRGRLDGGLPRAMVTPDRRLPRLNGRTAFLVVAAGGLCTVAWVLAADAALVRAQLEAFRWWLAVPAIALTLANVAVRLVRWQYLLRRAGVPLPMRRSAGIFVAGLAMLLTPAYAGEGVKTWLVAREGQGTLPAQPEWW